MMDDIKELTEPNEIDYKDLYIRLLADHDNYVKRTNKVMSDIGRSSQSRVMSDIVMSIYNDLSCAVEQNVEGTDLLLSKMKSIIEKSDYEIIDDLFITNQLNGYFDTDYCEAISVSPTTINEPFNTVVCVTKVGLYDKIKKQTISHAQCVVAN